MKTLTFIYSYHMGGWGDMLKGLHTTWCWAKATNRTLRIDFTHHIFSKIFPQHQYNINTCTIQAIDKLGKISVSDIEIHNSLQDISVICNWFDINSIGTVDPLPFFQELYTTIFPLPEPEPPKPYHALHCRLGDKYLTEAYACKSDNRIQSFDTLKTVIKSYKTSTNRIMICSDHSSAITTLLNNIPNSFCLCPKPYHIAYNNSNIETRLSDIKAMILEHRALTNAETITMVSYSGFPITAAIHHNTPIFLWKNDTKQPYKDDLIDNIAKKFEMK